ncbi:solute carrier family 66 member 2 isoform X1 [Nasonia vitripennis]|uniref:Solute carrier family 66 member 2 n=1 Tax=Nasonia vitripennis TaxID=7425 RepID=A0A7M7G3K8_NASVI|nr:solute carrier family 66 member 2 isoform X1 [Nasonia vitripennis]
MLETWEELNIENVAGWVASATMIFGGVVPFIPQCREIKRKGDTEGFSLYVCLTLLIANTLRILFWFGRHFELPLLFQSILMIATMFFMIRVCVNIRSKQQITKQKDRVFTDFDTKFFWKWTDFQSYVDFMLLFAFVGTVMMYLLIDIPIFVESIGLLALLTEAMLGLPQFIRNFINKSTEGMSIAMVIMWTMGDTFKTCYFIQRSAPVQFQICGVLQILIDLTILAQVHLYRNNILLIRSSGRID